MAACAGARCAVGVVLDDRQRSCASCQFQHAMCMTDSESDAAGRVVEHGHGDVQPGPVPRRLGFDQPSASPRGRGRPRCARRTGSTPHAQLQPGARTRRSIPARRPAPLSPGLQQQCGRRGRAHASRPAVVTMLRWRGRHHARCRQGLHGRARPAIGSEPAGSPYCRADAAPPWAESRRGAAPHCSSGCVRASRPASMPASPARPACRRGALNMARMSAVALHRQPASHDRARRGVVDSRARRPSPPGSTPANGRSRTKKPRCRRASTSPLRQQQVVGGDDGARADRDAGARIRAPTASGRPGASRRCSDAVCRIARQRVALPK